MKFGYTILYVPDVAAALEFYEKAFGMTRAFLHESGSFGQLATGDTALAFCADSLLESDFPFEYRKNAVSEKPAGFEVCLLTDDVPAAFQKATAAGATAMMEPVQKPWGQTVAYVRDLNGVLVEIATPMG